MLICVEKFVIFQWFYRFTIWKSVFEKEKGFYVKYFVFFQLGQKQRDFYSDKSGTKKCVDYFKIPSSAEDQLKRKSQL